MPLDLAHHRQAMNDVLSLGGGDGAHFDDLLLLILSRGGGFLIVFVVLAVAVVRSFVAVPAFSFGISLRPPVSNIPGQ